MISYVDTFTLVYSLMSFSEGGYVLSDITFDLHSTGEELITTEYEDKFSECNKK